MTYERTTVYSAVTRPLLGHVVAHGRILGRLLLAVVWRQLASAAMEEGIRRTQQQSVPPQVPQVGRAGGEMGASPSIRRPMLVASVAEAKTPSRGILQVCPEAPAVASPARLSRASCGHRRTMQQRRCGG